MPVRPRRIALLTGELNNRFPLLLAVSEGSEDVAFFAFLNDDDFNGLLARRLQRLELSLESIGCSGEPRPEPGEPIGRPLAVVPTVLPSVGPPELFAGPPADVAGAVPCVLPGCAIADP